MNAPSGVRLLGSCRHYCLFLISLQCCHCHKSNIHYMRICLWTFQPICLISVCAPISPCFNYSSVLVSLDIEQRNLFSFARSSLFCCFGFLHFHLHFRTSLLISTKKKNPPMSLVRFSLILLVNLRRMDLLLLSSHLSTWHISPLVSAFIFHC